jgi:hypothetical protein
MGVKGTSEDFVWMDTKDWSEERLRGAERLRDELGYFIKGKAHETRMTEAEYPGT